jgi:hypothetical protein
LPKGVSEAFEQLYLLHSPCVHNKVERSCQKGTLSVQYIGTLIDKTLGDDQDERGCQSEGATSPALLRFRIGAGNNTRSV